MDSFAEPNKPQPESYPVLSDVREQVYKLEQEHKAKGIPLSGRIIHLCHYLPVTCSLSPHSTSKNLESLPSPPPTPPQHPSDIPASPLEETSASDAFAKSSTSLPERPESEIVDQGRWKISLRYGHSAMISGITSLSSTHQQIIIGWTGDVQATSPSGGDHTEAEAADAPPGASGPINTSGSTKVPLSAIAEEDKTLLADVLRTYPNTKNGKALGGDGDVKETQYIPVWVEDKVAHGHYDGYCKQSE